MHSFAKIVVVFIAATSFSFTSCKGKTGKPTIVGKWIYKALIHTSSDKKELEVEDEEAKGTIMIFNKDNTFSISQPGQKQGSMTGTYKITEDGELSMTQTGDPKVETVKVLWTGKNTLQFHHQKDGITFIFNRIPE